MSVQSSITEKLSGEFSPVFIDLVNESHMHSGPANRETHFKLTLVSDIFSTLRKVQRHQKVYAVLAHELQNGVHALAMHLYSPAEWQERNGQSPESPACLGGGKK